MDNKQHIAMKGLAKAIMGCKKAGLEVYACGTDFGHPITEVAYDEAQGSPVVLLNFDDETFVEIDFVDHTFNESV